VSPVTGNVRSKHWNCSSNETSVPSLMSAQRR